MCVAQESNWERFIKTDFLLFTQVKTVADLNPIRGNYFQLTGVNVLLI